MQNKKETITGKESTHSKIYQSINSNTIFFEKNNSVFSKTCHFVESLNYIDFTDILIPVISTLSYASLLFTMTIGTGINTAVAMYKRQPLLLSDVKNMCDTLEYLDTAKDNNKIDEIAAAINQYRIQDNSPSNLQIELAHIDSHKVARIKHNMPELNEQIRSVKVQLILDYLITPCNSGKDLQHFILGILQPISEEIKSRQYADNCVTSHGI